MYLLFSLLGHLTSMSDVYSFGVVLLELLTGRKSVDKKRPTREQDLVEWARPMLKDSLKLERIMDPGLEGQYSTEGARKVAALAYQCLSHHAKNRPSMRTVVKTLEPLMELTDIPVGHFVYVAPSEVVANIEGSLKKVDQKGGENDHDEVKENGSKAEEAKKLKKEKGHHRQRKSRSRRCRVKPLRSRAVYSDTALYKTLATSPYFPKQAPETDGDGHGPVLAIYHV